MGCCGPAPISSRPLPPSTPPRWAWLVLVSQTHYAASGHRAFAMMPACCLAPHSYFTRTTFLPPLRSSLGTVVLVSLVVLRSHPSSAKGVNLSWAPFVPVLTALTTSWHPHSGWFHVFPCLSPLLAPAKLDSVPRAVACHEVGHEQQIPLCPNSM